MVLTQKLDTVEFAPIGIWKLDLSLNVVEANRAAGRQLGLPSEDLIGRNILELVPALPKEMFLRTLEQGESVACKQIRVKKSGALDQVPSYWETWLLQLKSTNDKVSGLVLSTVEVTERELLKQQREDFIAAISHNLKSPLIGADMILDSLMRRAQGPLTVEQMESLMLLKNSNLELLEMVQELIEVYRYETKSANLNFERLNLASLVSACLKTFEEAASAAQVTLAGNVPADTYLVADRKALKKLLNNLLDNALRYTPAGGSVTVEGQVTASQITVRVVDTGCGIDLADPEVLFQRFWQGVAGKNYTAVTGLGLYLCRQIVNAHNGRISVKSRPKKGTTFSIILPKERLPGVGKLA
jgi:PAS domain S-box-containing protein